MKKSFALIALAAFLIVCVLLNVILFIALPKLAPEGRSSENAFRLVWLFTFPLNLFIWICGVAYLSRRSTDIIVHYPIVLVVMGGGFAAYVYVAFKHLFFARTLTMEKAILVESILTAVYLLAILAAFFILSYIGGNQEHTKEKVLFIRLLKADVDACIPMVQNPELKLLLGKLSEKVRFSDPMSHDSLKACENEISGLVTSMQMKLKYNEEDEIAADVKKIEMLLDYRNERCKILK